MRSVRIYQPGIYKVGEIIELTPESGQHVGVVLRMQVAEVITLFCGDNREFSAEIVNVKKRQVLVKIKHIQEVNRESPRSLHLAQAISKGFKMELVVQKAVELGVTSITPIITEYCAYKLDSERFEKKHKQWQAIAIAACEQCGRNSIPVIQEVIPLTKYIQNKPQGLHFMLSLLANKTWRDYNFGQAALNLIIGPEGGLSSSEEILLQEASFNPLSLGPRILRTETAAITAVSILQAICGDL